ncbi:MAG: alpha/beta hydrolase, partial [Pseudomonadota bacterium]|nr:alpha/beta hydrolase [Pseudomonadota bacterium]
EISGFISVAPPANLYDFSFLAPCPASGLIVHGAADKIVPKEDIERLVERLQAQKGITIDYDSIKNANHFFDTDMPALENSLAQYLDRRISEIG